MQDYEQTKQTPLARRCLLGPLHLAARIHVLLDVPQLPGELLHGGAPPRLLLARGGNDLRHRLPALIPGDRDGRQQGLLLLGGGAQKAGQPWQDVPGVAHRPGPAPLVLVCVRPGQCPAARCNDGLLHQVKTAELTAETVTV